MARALMMNAGPANTLGNSLTRYLHCVNAPSSPEPTEAHAQITYHNAGLDAGAAGSFSNLYVRVSTNNIDTSSTVRLRKNGANATQVVTVGAFATGEFEDTSTDAINDGDEVNYSVVTGAVADAPGDLLFPVLSNVYNPAANTVVRHAAVAFPDLSDGLTYYAALADLASSISTGEAAAKVDVNVDGTVNNLFVYVSQNLSLLATSIIVRLNGTNTSLVISVGSLVTGILESTTPQQTIAANDDLNYAIVAANSLAFVLETISVQYLTSVKGFHSISARTGGGVDQSPSTSSWAPLGGNISSSEAEGARKADLNIAGNASNLVLFVSTNTIT